LAYVDIDDVINLEIEQAGEFLEAAIIVDVTIGTKGERTCLQLCNTSSTLLKPLKNDLRTAGGIRRRLSWFQ
jgi:hypothetical protein